MLQQMFEVTAKIRSSSLKPMFTWKRRLLPCNAAHDREISFRFNIHNIDQIALHDNPIFFMRLDSNFAL